VQGEEAYLPVVVSGHMCAYAEMSGLGKNCTLSYVVSQVGVCCFDVHSLAPVIHYLSQFMTYTSAS
jgi:hypothetical protein